MFCKDVFLGKAPNPELTTRIPKKELKNIYKENKNIIKYNEKDFLSFKDPKYNSQIVFIVAIVKNIIDGVKNPELTEKFKKIIISNYGSFGYNYKNCLDYYYKCAVLYSKLKLEGLVEDLPFVEFLELSEEKKVKYSKLYNERLVRKIYSSVHKYNSLSDEALKTLLNSKDCEYNRDVFNSFIQEIGRLTNDSSLLSSRVKYLATRIGIKPITVFQIGCYMYEESLKLRKINKRLGYDRLVPDNFEDMLVFSIYGFDKYDIYFKVNKIANSDNAIRIRDSYRIVRDTDLFKEMYSPEEGLSFEDIILMDKKIKCSDLIVRYTGCTPYRDRDIVLKSKDELLYMTIDGLNTTYNKLIEASEEEKIEFINEIGAFALLGEIDRNKLLEDKDRFIENVMVSAITLSCSKEFVNNVENDYGTFNIDTAMRFVSKNIVICYQAVSCGEHMDLETLCVSSPEVRQSFDLQVSYSYRTKVEDDNIKKAYEDSVKMVEKLDKANERINDLVDEVVIKSEVKESKEGLSSCVVERTPEREKELESFINKKGFQVNVVDLSLKPDDIRAAIREYIDIYEISEGKEYDFEFGEISVEEFCNYAKMTLAERQALKEEFLKIKD